MSDDIAFALRKINHWANRCAALPIKAHLFILSRWLLRWGMLTQWRGRGYADSVAVELEQAMAPCSHEGLAVRGWRGPVSAVALCKAAHAAALVANPEVPEPAWEVIRPLFARRVARTGSQRQRRRPSEDFQRER